MDTPRRTGLLGMPRRTNRRKKVGIQDPILFFYTEEQRLDMLPEAQQAVTNFIKKGFTKMADVQNIQIVDGLDIPSAERESKYPWKDLMEAAPGKRAFVIPVENEAEGKQIKGAIYSHGVAYFTSRELEFLPLVRVFQKDDGSWNVAAFIKVRDEGGE